MTEATGSDVLVMLLLFSSVFAFLVWAIVYAMNEWGKNKNK